MSLCRTEAPCIAQHLTDAEHDSLTACESFVLVLDRHDLVNAFAALDGVRRFFPQYRAEANRVRDMIRDQLARQNFFPPSLDGPGS